MRLMLGDTVRLHIDEEPLTMRVAKVNGNGQVFMSETNEANVDARNRDKDELFMYLSKMAGSFFKAQARRVTISPIGELNDPGFKE